MKQPAGECVLLGSWRNEAPAPFRESCGEQASFVRPSSSEDELKLLEGQEGDASVIRRRPRWPFEER